MLTLACKGGGAGMKSLDLKLPWISLFRILRNSPFDANFATCETSYREDYRYLDAEAFLGTTQGCGEAAAGMDSGSEGGGVEDVFGCPEIVQFGGHVQDGVDFRHWRQQVSANHVDQLHHADRLCPLHADP